MAADLNDNDAILFTFLNNISEDLASENLKHMIFLLYDSDLSRSKLEKVQSGNDLFGLLIDADMMSWQFLGNILALIRRTDLQDKVIRFSQEFKVPSMCVSAFNASRVPTSLRKLMYQMGVDMSSEMIDDIKFYETSLPRGDKLDDALDILDYFIKVKPIRNIFEIQERLGNTPHILELYQKHFVELEEIDCSETSSQHSTGNAEHNGNHEASCPYRDRFSSLFSCEDVPIFETEYLQTEDLVVQEDNRAATELGRGTFGVINTGFYKKKEVEVKSFHNSESIQMHDLKMIVYLRHPFLLSIIKAEFSPRLRLVYCIKPKRNLAKFLKDKDRLQGACCPGKKKRVKILCQISDALNFLHTPVTHIRGPVIHMNVKPHNIFLDAYDNALLGDIDTAVEIQDEATHRSFEGFETEGYADRYKEDKRKKKPAYDVFSLGIVTLQVLKWQPASVADNLGKVELFDRVSELICSKLQQPITELVNKDQLKDVIMTTDFIDENVWTSGDECTSQTIGHMAFQCLLNPEIRITAAQYSAKLKEILDTFRRKLWDSATDDKRCIQCHFYDKNEMLETTSETCTKACIFHNRFCKDCHYYSFRNPLHCPYHGIVYSMIGNPKSFALLICGYDQDNWQYRAFQKDIDYVKRVITDPRIMNIRLENILEVRKGGIENTATFEAQVSRKLGGKVEFLFVYYSGHGIKNGIINVTENDEDSIEIKKLMELLGDIQRERLLVLFDCCFAAYNTFVPDALPGTYKWITILYSSDEDKSAMCNAKEGSIFTRYFLAGLQSTQTCVCQEKNKQGEIDNGKCPALEKFRKESAKTGFIELQNLTKYICHPAHETVNQKPQQHNMGRNSIDMWGNIIAYYNESPDPVAYNFRFIHLPSKVEIPIQLEQIDHSAPQLEEAVLKRLSKEIEKYAPIADVTPDTKFQLKSEAGREINTVNEFKKLAMRNECFMVYNII